MTTQIFISRVTMLRFVRLINMNIQAGTKEIEKRLQMQKYEENKNYRSA